VIAGGGQGDGRLAVGEGDDARLAADEALLEDEDRLLGGLGFGLGFGFGFGLRVGCSPRAGRVGAPLAPPAASASAAA
jgi:hypothetical protein